VELRGAILIPRELPDDDRSTDSHQTDRVTGRSVHFPPGRHKSLNMKITFSLLVRLFASLNPKSHNGPAQSLWRRKSTQTCDEQTKSPENIDRTTAATIEPLVLPEL